MKENLNNLTVKNEFRLRGTEMTRLETFMDAAFAFATTMLVIAGGEIPRDYPELIKALKEIPSFISSFFIIMLFWMGHRNWSRQYGLEDGKTIIISIMLIFVLLVYVYPLRLMFSALFAWSSGNWLPARFTLHSQQELIGLFKIYGLGLFSMAGLMALLYVRAGSARILLKLNAVEMLQTKAEITGWSITSFTGLFSTLFAWFMPASLALWAPFLYLILPIFIPVTEVYYQRKKKRMIKQH